MARIDNLENFLTDVASAIKTKKGTTDKIPAEMFDMEIEMLPQPSFTGSTNVILTKSVEELSTTSDGMVILPKDLDYTDFHGITAYNYIGMIYSPESGEDIGTTGALILYCNGWQNSDGKSMPYGTVVFKSATEIGELTEDEYAECLNLTKQILGEVENE